MTDHHESAESHNESNAESNAAQPHWLEAVRWNDAGLVQAVAQSRQGEVLMVAWMNREALCATVAEGRAVYYSRSRKKLWRKGEQSGHIQQLIELRLDCDGDALLLRVDQIGLACHTGRRTCFYRQFDDERWREVEAMVKTPREIYGA